MFPFDSLVLDLVFPATARPTGEQLLAGLGGEEVARQRKIVDVDVDLPEIEMQVSPTFMLRRQGDRRLVLVDDENAPMRQNPRADPVVQRDLRPEKDRLVALVEHTGARFGRMWSFGVLGEAVIVARSARDIRAILLIGWALDPETDESGRRVGRRLTQKDFELKLGTYAKRLEELDDAVVLGRIPAGMLEKKGEKGKELYVVSVLDALTGFWDLRKSYELESKVAALDLFSRIPGARQNLTPAEPEPAAPAAAAPPAAKPAAPPEPPEPPKPEGPPIAAAELDGRIVLKIPAERFDLDAVTALGRHKLDLLTGKDQVSGKQRERIHQEGCGFIAPLAFLSEVFLDGKPLDKKRFEAEAKAISGGRALEAHLPRFGPVMILEAAGKRWVTSELAADPARLLALLP